jgi:hypothetical protein
MPVLHEVDPHSSIGALDNFHYIVISCMGTRPTRAFQEGAQGLDPPTCCDRQVHQVDRGKGPSEDWLQVGSGFHTGHHFLLWSP